jgi:hypothetical protein
MVTNSNPNPAGVPAEAGLRAIKPPVAIPNGWLWLWACLAVIVLGALGFWLWRRYRKSREEAAVVPPVPPHVRARELLRQALGHIHEPRVFCVMVSDAVRHYLEERFDFHAPDRTTEEFLHELSATPLLLPDQKESLGEFLQGCDLVKFARYEPREPELHDLHGRALRLVEETEPQPEPIVVEGAHVNEVPVAAGSAGEQGGGS